MTAPPLTVPSPAAPRAGAADDVAIRLRGLTLGYGPASAPPIVEDLDLDVPAGRVTAIIGANGCGKSTLLRGLTRQLAPRAGSIEVLGRTPPACPRATTPAPWRCCPSIPWRPRA